MSRSVSTLNGLVVVVLTHAISCFLEELTITEECILRATEAGFTVAELKSLKQVLAKKSDSEIFAAIAKLSGDQRRIDLELAVSFLYSLTDQQMDGLGWALKTGEGWD